MIAVTFSPTGRLLAGAVAFGPLVLWDVPTRTEIGRIEKAGMSWNDLAFNSKGSLLVGGGSDGRLYLWDAKGKPIGEPIGKPTPPGQKDILRISLSPDDQTVVAATQDGLVVQADVKNKRVVRSIRAHELEVCATAFSPDGKHFASASKDKTIKIWDLEGKPVGAAIRTRAAACALAFSPDGQTIISGEADGYLRRRNPLDGQETHAPTKVHNGPVEALVAAFDEANWANLYTGGGDAFVALYSHRTGKQLSIDLANHQDMVTDLSLSGDKKMLASASADGTVRLWQANWQTWLETSCNRLRKHPAFQNPATWQGPEPGMAQKAKDVCAEQVWNKD